MLPSLGCGVYLGPQTHLLWGSVPMDRCVIVDRKTVSSGEEMSQIKVRKTLLCGRCSSELTFLPPSCWGAQVKGFPSEHLLCVPLRGK